MNRTLIENLIQKHEGTRYSVYTDSRGNLTIGCGFNLNSGDAAHICGLFGIDYNAISSGTANLTQAQVYEIFEYQLNVVIGQAIQIFPKFAIMPDNATAVICDCIFNMGLPVFLEFKQTIAALKVGDYKSAATNLQDSKWYIEVQSRGVEDVALLESA
jgi:lysozyme